MSRLPAVALIFLPVIVLSASCNITYGDEPPFRITTKRDDDKVHVTVENDKAAISVRCPSGISQATIERRGEKWPTTVTMRLHLTGLEKFKVTNGKNTLEGAVSSQSGKVRLWKDGKEDSPLDSEHPFWMEIRMFGGDGKPRNTIPLKDGYFEMQLPKDLFENDPKSITLNWIDFYR